MKIQTFAVLAFLLLLFSLDVQAQEVNTDNDTAKQMANDLAGCSGVYLANAEVMKSIGKGNASETFEGIARGAYLAAAYLVNGTGVILDWDNAQVWAQSIRDTQKFYWLGLMELSPSMSENGLPEEFLNALDFCVALNPIQTEIVEMMRDEVYSR